MIRPVLPTDAPAWHAFRSALWPETSVGENEADIERFFWSLGEVDTGCLVAEEDGVMIGFAELSVRSYADGCESDRYRKPLPR